MNSKEESSQSCGHEEESNLSVNDLISVKLTLLGMKNHHIEALPQKKKLKKK